MLPEALSFYEMWDLKPFSRPPHSRLHHLEPVGLGTAAVESLTGYVTRLGETHGVSTRTLMIHELVPLLGRERLTRPVNSGLSSFWSKDARSLNGTGHLALDLVAALQTMTLRQDLRFLTLLTWANVLPPRGLLRRNRVWCPACYETWRQAGQVIYEPLLWSLEVMTICPLHHCYLHSTCHHLDCQASQPILGPRSRPGYCSHCERWLGVSSTDLPSENTAVPEEEWAWQTWVAREVGDLFVHAPGPLAEPTVQNVSSVVKRWIEFLTQGNANAFARRLQISTSSVSCWQSQRQRPQLGTLLRLCRLFRTPLLHVFAQGADAVDGSIFDQNEWVIEAKRPKRPRRAFDQQRVLMVLQDVLASNAEPPPAMRQVCKQLGYEHALVYTHYPDLCRSISARYMAYQKERGSQRLQQLCAEVRQAVFAVHQQGKYPSAYRVEALLSVPGFMRHPEARAVWHATLRELGWES
jgi:DNA-binding XRE family transcriptional regulator